MVETTADEARVEAVGGHTRPLQSPRQLGAEQDVRQLGLGVARETHRRVGALGQKIVERDTRTVMSRGGGGDHARRCARFQPLEEQRRQQKRREIVHRPGQLDPVA